MRACTNEEGRGFTDRSILQFGPDSSAGAGGVRAAAEGDRRKEESEPMRWLARFAAILPGRLLRLLVRLRHRRLLPVGRHRGHVRALVEVHEDQALAVLATAVPV